MSLNFECHITCKAKDAQLVAQLGEEVGWKFSQIDGDPVLGKELFCYLTMHKTKFQSIYVNLQAAQTLLSSNGIEVVRSKIELILYDTKTGVGV